ncbi:MAG TPA: hypothetical protein VGK10_11990 [Prolixibacteraceae bacterium]|jgi:hypothetical protein
MKKLKCKDCLKVAIFIAILVVFSSSCKAKDPVLPEYAGTWVSVNYLGTSEGFSWFKETYTFTETTFSRLMQLQLPAGEWIDLDSSNGSMTFNGKIINFTTTAIGRTSYEKGLPTGKITRYSAGSDIFDHYLLEIGQSISIPTEWSVSGNLMTNQTDYNFDGDFLDEGEARVYTRQ